MGAKTASKSSVVDRMSGELELFFDEVDGWDPLIVHLWDRDTPAGVIYGGFTHGPVGPTAQLKLSEDSGKSGLFSEIGDQHTPSGSNRYNGTGGFGVEVQEIERVVNERTGRLYRFPNYKL